jgi:hypothetical protein
VTPAKDFLRKGLLARSEVAGGKPLCKLLIGAIVAFAHFNLTTFDARKVKEEARHHGSPGLS